MDLHLSRAKITDYLENKLAADELLPFDDHLSACGDCSRKLADAAADSGHSLGIDRSRLHLSYDVLESYVNDTLGPFDEDVADVHLKTCGDCRNELHDLVQLRDDLVAIPTPSESVNERSAFWLSLRAFLKPAYLAAFVIIIAAVAGIWWFASDGSRNNDQAAVPEIRESQPPVVDLKIEQKAANTTDQPSNEKAGITLDDRGRVIELFSDGRVAGLPSTRFEESVRKALANGEISIPAEASDLRGETGVLMGEPANGVPFGLISPVGKVIESVRPRLNWKPLPGAESYKVQIFDESYRLVAVSPQTKNTSWQADRLLARGRTYRWQIIAVKDGVEIKSPVRPAPDANFFIVTRGAANGLIEARKSGGSHLMLGIAYAEAGMLAEAEREFRALQRRNPNSATVKRLLQKTRAAR